MHAVCTSHIKHSVQAAFYLLSEFGLLHGCKFCCSANRVVCFVSVHVMNVS